MPGEVAAAALIVRAKFQFFGKNNDELCFKKNDLITITQQPDGGWWEGTCDGKTGWFPSNYVDPVAQDEEVIADGSFAVNTANAAASALRTPVHTVSGSGVGAVSGVPSSEQKSVYLSIVLRDLVESELNHVKRLRTLMDSYLVILAQEAVIPSDDFKRLCGNLSEVIAHQEHFLELLEINQGKPTKEQRIGEVFMGDYLQAKQLYKLYCSNHPLAVQVLEKHRQTLAQFMESRSSTLMALTQGLSAPFRRLDKYPSFLQELERNMEENNPDRGAVQRAADLFRELTFLCNSVRKQRELQLELSACTIHGLEGESLKSLGEVLLVGNVDVLDGADSLEAQPANCCLVLLAHSLVFLTVAPKLNGYVFKSRLSLNGVCVRRVEDESAHLSRLELQVAPHLATSQPIRVYQLTYHNVDELKQWLEALQAHEGVTCDIACNMISPTMPSHYDHVQGDLSPAVRPEVSTMPSPGHADLKKSLTASAGNDMETLPGHPYQPKLWSTFSLRPYTAPCVGKPVSAASKVKLRRKDVATQEEQEDAIILSVVEAYCSSARTVRPLPSSLLNTPQLIIAEDEKMFVEETVGDETVIREQTLVDTVYDLRDQLSSAQEEIRKIHQLLKKEQRSRKTLEDRLRKNSSYVKSINVSVADDQASGITVAQQPES